MHEEMYRSREVPQYEKPRYRAGRIIMVVVLSTLLISLIAVGLWIGYRLLNPTAIRTTREIRTFTLSAGAQPMLIVSDNDGFVHVRPGTGNTITVTTTKVGDSFGASPADFKVRYNQNGNTITVQVHNDSIHLFDFSTTSQADLEVTVPTGSDLRIATNSGDITTTGIQGKMALTSNSGSLQATDVSLKGASLLSTNSGNITMRGSIASNGHYIFQSNSGDVDVALPRDTSFHADLMSVSGTVRYDFPLILSPRSIPSGRTIIGEVGSAPLATVTMQSDSGSLQLGQI